MNILLLAPDFYPPLGGIGTYSFEIANHLSERHNIFVVTLSDNIYIPNININVIYANGKKDGFFDNIGFQLFIKKNIIDIINKHSIDIIHTHSTMPDVLIDPKNIDIPIVTTIHTNHIDEYNAIRNSKIHYNNLSTSEKYTIIFNPLLRYIQKNYYEKRNYFLTVSNWQKDVMLSQGFSKKMQVIYNGVDANRFSPQSINKNALFYNDLIDDESFKILFLSRAVERKGFSIFCKAMELLNHKYDIKVVVGGRGLKPSIDIKPSKLYAPGYIDEADKPSIYNLTDVYVLPSYLENFPIGILEAMACKSCVVSSKVGGIPELINHLHNGMLIKSHTPQSVSEAISLLIENPKLKNKISENARQTIIGKYEWKNIAEEIEQYYEMIIDENSHPEPTKI